MCVGTSESLILASDMQQQIADQSVQCDQSFHGETSECNQLASRSEAHSSRVSEKSAQCSATVENSDDSASFYLRFKENEDPQKPNGWDSSGEKAVFEINCDLKAVCLAAVIFPFGILITNCNLKEYSIIFK